MGFRERLKIIEKSNEAGRESFKSSKKCSKNRRGAAISSFAQVMGGGDSHRL